MLGHRPQSQSLGPYAHHNSSRSFCNSTPNDLNDCFTLLSGLRSSRCSQAPCGMPITPLPSITSGSITPLYIPTDYLTLDFWCASTQRQKSLFRQNTSGEPPPPQIWRLGQKYILPPALLGCPWFSSTIIVPRGSNSWFWATRAIKDELGRAIETHTSPRVTG